MSSFDLSIYLVLGSDVCRGRAVTEVVAAALQGGVTAVQLREKAGTDRERYALACAVQELIVRHNAGRPVPVLFLVNDRLDLAIAAGADGCHLGQDDLPIPVARRLARHLVLGTSVESEVEAHRAWVEGCDYVGTGPVYATSTKGDAGEPYGPAIVRRIKAAVPIPVVGSGGTPAATAGPVWAAGADGVAVASAVAATDDPAAAARALGATHPRPVPFPIR